MPVGLRYALYSAATANNASGLEWSLLIAHDISVVRPRCELQERILVSAFQ